MDNKGQYSKEDLEQPIVKLAEELDHRQQQDDLAKHTTGRQAGYGKADCDNVVESQKETGKG